MHHYLVLILSGRTPEALLFDADRRLVRKLDPTGGLARELSLLPRVGNTEDAAWDAALSDHTPGEREDSSCYVIEASRTPDRAADSA